MLCAIPHICKDEKYHSDIDHRKQVNNVIETLFHGLYVYEIAVTQDLFWTEYTEFDNKVGSFDGDEFIWKINNIRDGKSHLWHKNIHFLAPSSLVLLHVELHQRLLLLVQNIVLKVM